MALSGEYFFIIINFFYYSLRSKSPFLALSSSSSVVVYIFLLSVCQLLFIHTLFTLPLCIHIDSIDTFFPPPSTFTTLFIQLLSFARCLSANFFTFFYWTLIEKFHRYSFVCVCMCERCEMRKVGKLRKVFKFIFLFMMLSFLFSMKSRMRSLYAYIQKVIKNYGNMRKLRKLSIYC